VAWQAADNVKAHGAQQDHLGVLNSAQGDILNRRRTLPASLAGGDT